MQVQGMLAAQKQAAAFERYIMRGIDIATRQEAHELRKEMVLGLRNQAPGGKAIRPLSEMTILLRGLPRGGGGGGKGKKGKLGFKISRTKRDSSGRLRRNGKFVSSKNNRPGLSISFSRGKRSGGGRKRQGKRVHHGFMGPVKKGQKRARRGSTKALINRGDLIGGIKVKTVGWAHYTVGVHRGERGGKSGKDLVNIAEIQENGTKEYSMTVTAKMAKFSKFLVVMGILHVPWHPGKVLRRKVPARPFLGPAHDVWEVNAGNRFDARLDMQLTGRSV